MSNISTIDGILDKYSAKVYKNRKKHMLEIVDDKPTGNCSKWENYSWYVNS